MIKNQKYLIPMDIFINDLIGMFIAAALPVSTTSQGIKIINFRFSFKILFVIIIPMFSNCSRKHTNMKSKALHSVIFFVILINCE